MMIAALGTLPFLATLWLLVVVGAKVLEESGAKIAAALKGSLGQQSAKCSARPAPRHRRPVQSLSSRAPLLRAAA